MISTPELRSRGVAYLEQLFGDGAADAVRNALVAVKDILNAAAAKGEIDA